MPSQHRSFKDWTHSRVIKEAARLGTHASLLALTIMRSPRHPEQGVRSCVGILRLAKTSTPIAPQIPIADWHNAIGDTALADAILDRLAHNACRIEEGKPHAQEQRQNHATTLIEQNR